MTRLFFLFLCFNFSTWALAQEESKSTQEAGTSSPPIEDLSALSLEDLMKIEVALPSKKKQSQQSAAAILSVVTREDIELYGMRDLSEILRLVPGFEFGLDTLAIVGLGSRGVWVHEGKALIMINGIMVNEQGFGNVNILGAFPAAMIEKVEIIRGPGSAVYGGVAEANVINIITRSGKDLSGGVVNAEAGLMVDEFTKNGNIAYGKLTDTVEYSFHLGRSIRPFSSKQWKDFFGASMDFNQANMGRDWQHLITEMKYKENLVLRYNKVSMDIIAKSGIGIANDPFNSIYPDRLNVDNNAIDLQYTIAPSSKLNLATTLTYIEVGFSGSPKNKVRNYKGEVRASYDLSEDSQLSAGTGYIMDWARSIYGDGSPGLHTSPGLDKYSVGNESHYAFLQWIQSMDKFNFTVGGRYENTIFGDAVAPRVGITYTNEAFNSKLLYGGSYRVPFTLQAFGNANATNPSDFRPEKSETWEYEISYLFQRNLSAKLNIFYLEIKDVITFDNTQFLYLNQGKVANEGIEGEVQYRLSNIGGFFNFSYVRPRSETSSGYVTNDKEHFLGLPHYKLNLGGYWIWGKFQLGPTLTYLSTRYGQTAVSANSGGADLSYKSYDAILLTNVTLNWHGLGKDTDVRLSVNNLFDEDYLLIQPFYSGHAPMPAFDREVLLSLEARL
ncbi:MAG: TonB-dependent receptor plug domain-containing protein [Bdellovibrionota bacterium]